MSQKVFIKVACTVYMTYRWSSGDPLGVNVDALRLEALLPKAFLPAVGLDAVGVLGDGQLVYYHLSKGRILYTGIG